jgi:hypothetical protein
MPKILPDMPGGFPQAGPVGINLDKREKWPSDIRASVALYNEWFMTFAPEAFRTERKKAANFVEDMLKLTNDLRGLTPEVLKKNPTILPALRMCCCPPIARDRLIGLSGTVDSVVDSMEKNGCVPIRMVASRLDEELAKIGSTILKMVDVGIFPWIAENKSPSGSERSLASGIIADRLCGAAADPIVRNAQERRQLAAIGSWLERRNYRAAQSIRIESMASGTFGFRVNVRVAREEGGGNNIPVDVAIMPLKAARGELPILIEAKSAGDFTNVNKRRKEEAAKMQQLRHTYGKNVRYVLFLCGYFDTGYLEYEACEGIDWVWEHRIDELGELEL